MSKGTFTMSQKELDRVHVIQRTLATIPQAQRRRAKPAQDHPWRKPVRTPCAPPPPS